MVSIQLGMQRVKDVVINETTLTAQSMKTEYSTQGNHRITNCASEGKAEVADCDLILHFRIYERAAIYLSKWITRLLKQS